MQEKSLSIESFSERLKFALAKRGLKATPLAKKLGISTGYLSDLLKGSKSNPSLETLRKLSGELRCRLVWLESGEGQFEEPPYIENAKSSANPYEPDAESSILREDPSPYRTGPPPADARRDAFLARSRELNLSLDTSMRWLIQSTLEKMEVDLWGAAMNDGEMQRRMLDLCRDHLLNFEESVKLQRSNIKRI